MHSLETIKRLNNESQDKWVANQAQPDAKTTITQENTDQGFLIFSIKQAIGLASSNEEVTTLLNVVLRLVVEPEKA